MRTIANVFIVGFFVIFGFSTVFAQEAESKVLKDFSMETGIDVCCVTDTSLLNEVRSWQGKGDYPGVDNWATGKVANNFDLLGGLPGQSAYYSVAQTLERADTIKRRYWKSLQVKKNKEHGYRPMVGIFRAQDSIVVAISKTLSNREYGKGGAWQLYVKNYATELMPMDTVYFKK